MKYAAYFEYDENQQMNKAKHKKRHHGNEDILLEGKKVNFRDRHSQKQVSTSEEEKSIILCSSGESETSYENCCPKLKEVICCCEQSETRQEISPKLEEKFLDFLDRSPLVSASAVYLLSAAVCCVVSGAWCV